MFLFKSTEVWKKTIKFQCSIIPAFPSVVDFLFKKSSFIKIVYIPKGLAFKIRLISYTRSSYKINKSTSLKNEDQLIDFQTYGPQSEHIDTRIFNSSN